MDKRNIFEVFDIDIDKLDEKLSGIQDECVKKGLTDEDYVKLMIKRLTPKEMAVSLRLQIKYLKSLDDALSNEVAIAYN